MRTSTFLCYYKPSVNIISIVAQCSVKWLHHSLFNIPPSCWACRFFLFLLVSFSIINKTSLVFLFLSVWGLYQYLQEKPSLSLVWNRRIVKTTIEATAFARAGTWAPLTVGYRAALGNAQPERQGYLEGPSQVPFRVAFLEPGCKTEPLICTSRHWMKCFQRITSLILTTTHFTGEKTEAQKIQGKLNLPSWQKSKDLQLP